MPLQWLCCKIRVLTLQRYLRAVLTPTVTVTLAPILTLSLCSFLLMVTVAAAWAPLFCNMAHSFTVSHTGNSVRGSVSCGSHFLRRIWEQVQLTQKCFVVGV